MDKIDSESESSEEFFDAEDTTPNRLSKKSSPRSSAETAENDFIFPEPELKINQSIATDDDDDENTTLACATPSTISPSTSLSAKHLRQDDHVFVEPKSLGMYGRQRFRELRQCMQNDEDEHPGNTLTPDSQNSSTDGMYSTRPSHPFRIIENDAISLQSMTSLGRVGRILGGSIDPSSISVDRESIQTTGSLNSQQQQQQGQNFGSSPASSSGGGGGGVSGCGNTSQSTTPENQKSSNKSSEVIISTKQDQQQMHQQQEQQQQEDDNDEQNLQLLDNNNKIILQEPDVIASTKLAHSKTTDSIISSGPIAPPRRKKKSRKISTSSSEQFNMNEGFKLPPIERENLQPQPSSSSLFQQQQRQQQQLQQQYQQQQKIVTQQEAQKIRDDLVKELENSWNEASQRQQQQQHHHHQHHPNRPTTIVSGSMGRISHSLGNSSTSVYSKPSPSNSAKSNSAPGRVSSSIDPSQGLNLSKATQGRYVVKPKDEDFNKAIGPSKEEIERVERILLENIPKTKLVGGSNSLGSSTKYTPLFQKSSTVKEQRRKSAGDEDVLKQMNIYVRTRTESGKQLTDMEILEQVPVKNLDTGENMPLSAVKPPPPPDGWNPLSLHIHKLTSHLEVGGGQKESDDESVIGIPTSAELVAGAGEEEEGETEEGNRLKRKTAKIKRFFGSTVRKTVDKAKSIASEVSHARHKEDVAEILDVVNPEQIIKIKASNTKKPPYEFSKLQHVQDLSGEHTGAVWCMKFSSCGRLLATAGQDRVLRIWVLKDAYSFFQDMRTKYNADQKSSPTPSQESLVSQQSTEESSLTASASAAAAAAAAASSPGPGPFMPKSFCTYIGHSSDLLDISWSKNYFILSSSMDKTVRLWHISRKECLCCFQHVDFVTAIAFHPRDDRYFLSGSLDGRLRLWNIPDKKVAVWNEVAGRTKLITAANFCANGQFAVVGTYDGRCIFYHTDQLKYHTIINVKSSRGKNSIGRKISGIEPMPGEDKILVTSNDSRVRLYILRDLTLSCKYKGYLNVSSQIKASFSHDGKFIIAGSENQCIYIWNTYHDYKLSSVRRDRSDFWEGIKAHNATVTCAIFAPHPEAIIKPESDEEISADCAPQQPDPLAEQHKKCCGYVLVSADFNGAIKVFINKTKPKHSSLPYTAIAD